MLVTMLTYRTVKAFHEQFVFMTTARLLFNFARAYASYHLKAATYGRVKWSPSRNISAHNMYPAVLDHRPRAQEAEHGCLYIYSNARKILSWLSAC